MRTCDFIIFILFILSSASPLSAQTSMKIKGHITSAETGQPIPDVNVEVIDKHQGTVSDGKGFYKLHLAVDSSLIRFTHVGFSSVERVISFHVAKNFPVLDISMEPVAVEVAGVTITKDGAVPKIASYNIDALELRNIANPLPDGMISIKTLPGVFSGNDQSSFYNVRGGSYDDNLVRLNGVEIFQPLIVRKGIAENPSVVNPWLVQSINLQTGAYPVFYGDKLSSVLDISYRDGSDSKLKAMAGLSTVRAEAGLEGRIGTIGSFTAAVRKIDYSYIWRDLKTEGSFNPDFRDIQANIILKPARNQVFNIFGLYSSSVYQVKPEAYGSYWDDEREVIRFTTYMDGEEKFQNEVALLGLNWSYRPLKWMGIRAHYSHFEQREREITDLATTFSFKHKDSLYTAWDEYEPEKGDRHEVYNNQLKINSALYRAAVIASFSNQQLHVGYEKRDVSFRDRINESVTGSYLFPTDPLEPFSSSADYRTTGVSIYGRHRLDIFRIVQLYSGLRYSRFSLNDEVLLMPRIRLTAAIGSNSDVSFAAGNYAQPPLYKEIRNTERSNRSDVLAQKAKQMTLGLQHHWGENRSSLKLEAFYKQMSDLISYDVFDVRTEYSGLNDSRGYAYGLDAHLRGMMTPDCISWVSYSYLVARENLTGDGHGWVPRPSDQRHILSLKLEDKMQRFPGSRIHVRVLYGSGTRYTNYSIFEDANGEFQMIAGERNAMTLRVYKRFDVGLTQEFHLGRIRISLREEVLNLFNRKNIMGYSWRIDERIERVLGGRTFMVGAQVVVN